MAITPINCKRGSSQLTLRRANLLDCRNIYSWLINAETRLMARNEIIFSFESHQLWWAESLNNPDRDLFLLLHNSDRIGLIRFDFVQLRTYEVSLLIDPTFRGMGYGSALLPLGISLFVNERSDASKLIASVRKINVASIKCFLRSGFTYVNEVDGFYNYFLNLSPAS